MPDIDFLIKKIIDTDTTVGSKYFQFLEYAIQNKDDSRFFLIDFPATVLQVNKFDENKIEDIRLSHLLEPTLYRINKLVIDNNDFELFKSELNDLSTFHVLKSPIEIRNEIINLFYKISDSFILNGYKIRFNKEIEKKIEHFKLLVNYNLFKDFKSWKRIENELIDFQNNIFNEIDEFRDKKKLKSLNIPNLDINDSSTFEKILIDIENSKKEIKSIINGPENRYDGGIKHLLYEFYLNSIIYKTFFLIGAYCVFTYRNKNFNGINYVKELWYHTKPNNENRAIFLGKTPVEFNAFWLFNLYLFGGVSSEVWIDWAARPGGFETYYDTKPYIVQYFLLCLTMANNKNIFPTSEQLFRLKANNKTDEIDIWYDIINRLIYRRSEIIDNFENLINESNVWDPLLRKEINEDGKKKIINADYRLKETKNSIINIIDNLNDIKNEMDELIPLDKEKILKAVKIIVGSYYVTSKIPDILDLKEYSDEKDFMKIGLRPQVMKSCLIKSIFVDCSVIWQDVGRDIALEEYNSLNIKLTTNHNIKTNKLENPNPIELYDEIKKIANRIKTDFNPNIILIHPEEYYQLEIESLKKESSLFKNIIYEKDETYLLINETKLKLISSPKFKEITVLDSNQISWIYKPDPETNERISVNIVESGKDPSKADVTAQTVFKIEIKDYKALEMITWRNQTNNQ